MVSNLFSQRHNLKENNYVFICECAKTDYICYEKLHTHVRTSLNSTARTYISCVTFLKVVEKYTLWLYTGICPASKLNSWEVFLKIAA